MEPNAGVANARSNPTMLSDALGIVNGTSAGLPRGWPHWSNESSFRSRRGDRRWPHEDLAPQFESLDSDERQFALARTHLREGQGAFRTRLLDAYDRRCAITGERTEPVLDAAHIQPYLGPRSSHIQNGLLLTKEFHALFDKGLVTVTPDLLVRVSPAIRERWTNGGRYYEHDGRRLAVLPRVPAHEPSRAALRWHNEHRFERGSVA